MSLKENGKDIPNCNNIQYGKPHKTEFRTKL